MTKETASPLPVDFGAMLGAGFLVSLANAISHGTYSVPALALLFVALGLVTWRFVQSRSARGESRETGKTTLTRWLLFAALLSMPITALCDPKVLAHAQAPWRVGRVAEVVSIVLLLSYLPFMGVKRESLGLRNLRFALFGVLTLIAGITALRTSPAPDIDVYTIQQRGAEAFLRGENPYVTVAIPDTDPENDMTIPYVYPPTSVYTGVLGVLVGGDVRYPYLLAVLVAGFALRYISRRAGRELPSLLEDGPALFVWLTPIMYMVVERAWLDPMQIGLVCAGAAAHVGKRRVLASVLFGLAISSKQSMFWLIPLVGVVLRYTLREWLVMLVAAALPVLPFAVADFGRLKFGNFDFMSSLRPRSDALVLGGWVLRTMHRVFPANIGFLLAAGTVAVAGYFMRGSISAFARATLITFFVFFLFNRWAFANYYYLITSLAALSAATSFQSRVPAATAAPAA